jgi:hypothetical protein
VTWFPVLIRGVDRGGRPVLRLGHPQLDRYLGFVGAAGSVEHGVGDRL